MEYGFMMGLSPREPIHRFAALARQAEESGFGMAWVADSQLIFKNAIVAMTLAASETKSIKIGPGVSNPVTRHIAELSNAMSSLNEVSDGRMVLGIGVGDSSVTPMGVRAATVSELGEHIKNIRALSNGEEISIGEKSIHMRATSKPYPIYISASQPRMLKLAGAIADGVIVLGGVDASLTQWQLDHVAAGAREAGRSLDDVFVDLWLGISVSDDMQQANREVRPYATSQARWFSRWKDHPDVLKPFVQEFQSAYTAYDFYYHVSRQAEHNDIISDELVDLVGVIGPVNRCVERIAPLLSMKVDRITFLSIPGGREERIKQFAEDLIPRLQKATPAPAASG